MTSELAVDSLELPRTLDPVPVGASVGVISGKVVVFEVSGLSIVAKDVNTCLLLAHTLKVTTTVLRL